MPNLYHGSPTSSIATIIPCESHIGSTSQIFATPDILCAAAYSLKPNLTKETIEASQKDIEMEYAQVYDLKVFTNQAKPPMMLFCHSDVENIFAKHPRGNVYLLDETNFKPMDSSVETCEYVSDKEAKTLACLQLSTEDAMRYGVQIFLCSNPQLFLEKQEKAIVDLNKSSQVVSEFWNSFYQAEIDAGFLIHHNQTKGINPMDLKSGKLADETYVRNPSLLKEKLVPNPSEKVGNLVKIFESKKAENAR